MYGGVRDLGEFERRADQGVPASVFYLVDINLEIRPFGKFPIEGNDAGVTGIAISGGHRIFPFAADIEIGLGRAGGDGFVVHY